MWMKSTGVFVLEECTIGTPFCGRPANHVYETVLINYPKRYMWAKDGSHMFYWHGSSHIPVPNSLLMEFIDQKLEMRSSIDICEMTMLVHEAFGRCRPSMTEIIITMVGFHRQNILWKIRNYIPATQIQRCWKRCISDPNYKMCKTRLMREALEPIF